MLKRELHLKNIRPLYDSTLIKVIIGLRRSGKSELLKSIRDELLERGVDQQHILYYNFELIDHLDDDYRQFHQRVLSSIIDNQRYYIMIDEVALLAHWEKVINSLKANDNIVTSIFITGSNSQLLAGELATLLTGRTATIRVFPFVFEEIIEYRQIESEHLEQWFHNYVQNGALPQRFDIDSEVFIHNYYQDLYDAIIKRDILSRYQITDIKLLERLINFMVDNNGNVFSVNRIVGFLHSQKEKVSPQTVYTYISYLLNCQLVQRLPRFDVIGKKVLEIYEKYYLADPGFINTLRRNHKYDYPKLLELIVCNEFRSRGYQMMIGKVADQEIDFIATKNGQKVYLQVSYLLASPETIEREFSVFKKVRDAYPRYVISLDKADFSADGVIHLNAISLFANFAKYFPD